MLPQLVSSPSSLRHPSRSKVATRAFHFRSGATQSNATHSCATAATAHQHAAPGGRPKTARRRGWCPRGGPTRSRGKGKSLGRGSRPAPSWPGYHRYHPAIIARPGGGPAAPQPGRPLRRQLWKCACHPGATQVPRAHVRQDCSTNFATRRLRDGIGPGALPRAAAAAGVSLPTVHGTAKLWRRHKRQSFVEHPLQQQ